MGYIVDKIHEKKVKQIINFIINNITFAEVSVMIVERATETAEFIVNNNLDPQNFDSPVSRKKLHKKMKNFKEEVLEEREEGWVNNIINKMGLGKNKEQGKKEHKGFVTKKGTSNGK
jgi:hypothetical protein